MERICIVKEGFCKYLIIAVVFLVGGCTVNPATGEKQFTGLLPAGQEETLGVSEHEKVKKTYGEFIDGPMAEYVSRIGKKVAQNTERSDVQYKFYVIDSPIVNAFAVPGGYIYVSRGLLALANSEAELAGVIAHEIGHITGRHAAERMSQGVLIGLGAAILSAATGSDTVGQVANVGSDLYIKSYSRSQETQADELGVRYLARAGYDPKAMASFLRSLDAQTKLDLKISGRSEGSGFNYFSTHPVTADRVTHASGLAVNYPQAGNGVDNRDVYLSMINGLTYGDSGEQGFMRGDEFYHPAMGFAFTIPKYFAVTNNPSELVAMHPEGSVLVLDSGRDDQGRDPLSYLKDNWMKGRDTSTAEPIMINGLRAATAAFAGKVNDKPVMIRVVAIEWKQGQFFRFQMAIPESAGTSIVEGLKRSTYSFRRMSEQEKMSIKPLRIRTFVASPGDTIGSAISKMSPMPYKEDRFHVLNAVGAGQPLITGQRYKVIAE